MRIALYSQLQTLRSQPLLLIKTFCTHTHEKDVPSYSQTVTLHLYLHLPHCTHTTTLVFLLTTSGTALVLRTFYLRYNSGTLNHSQCYHILSMLTEYLVCYHILSILTEYLVCYHVLSILTEYLVCLLFCFITINLTSSICSMPSHSHHEFCTACLVHGNNYVHLVSPDCQTESSSFLRQEIHLVSWDLRQHTVWVKLCHSPEKKNQRRRVVISTRCHQDMKLTLFWSQVILPW